MSNLAYIITDDGTIAVHVSGKQFLVAKEHPNYSLVKEALVSGETDEIEKLCHIPTALKKYTCGRISVFDEEIHFNGEPIHNTLVEKILQFASEGLPFEPMVKFLDNLMDNPSKRAVDELYGFLAHRGLAITEDGHFLAFKGIRSDWMDKYSGKCDNHPGQVLEMPRRDVDDNCNNYCSYGYHAGAWDYVKSYCTERVVAVKINPKDVVSIPADANGMKLRTCRYEVLYEIEDPEEHLKLVATSADGTRDLSVQDDNYNEEWPDDEEDNDPYYDEYPDCPCDDCPATICNSDCEHYDKW